MADRCDDSVRCVTSLHTSIIQAVVATRRGWIIRRSFVQCSPISPFSRLPKKQRKGNLKPPRRGLALTVLGHVVYAFRGKRESKMNPFLITFPALYLFFVYLYPSLGYAAVEVAFWNPNGKRTLSNNVTN